MRVRNVVKRRVLGPLFVLALMMMLGMTAMAAPSMTVHAPGDGETIHGTEVTVRVDVTEVRIVPSTVPLDQAGKQPEANRPGEGHLHFMLDLGSVVVWDRNEPYTFSNVPPGDHQLMVELVNNDHSPLSPPVVEQIQFRTIADQMLPRTGQASDENSRTGMAMVAVIGMALVAGGMLLRRRLV